ncbi:MAG: cupin domain-containing protein [Nanoarchaeota archaeon]|nr:cupin domain-containing protein [Nanoarchaeota archaeon]
MKIVNEKDVKAIDDLCGPLKEVYKSENISLATVVIKAGREAHLHKHPELEEVYYILSGRGKMRVGDYAYSIKKGDTFAIEPKDAPHKAINPYKKDMKILVVCNPKFDISLLEDLENG